MINKRASRKNGFTLIELIVVMAIILVMASFLIPKFNGYRAKAQKLKVVDTGRQIYLAVVESYIEGNENFNQEDISKTAQELLGLKSIQVINSSKENMSINYEVDKKQYYLEIDETNAGFKIKDSSYNQIYPPINSEQVSTHNEGDSDAEV